MSDPTVKWDLTTNDRRLMRSLRIMDCVQHVPVIVAQSRPREWRCAICGEYVDESGKNPGE